MTFVKILTRQLLFLTIGLLLAMPLTAEARQARSQVAKNIFKARHPCPSNGNRRGSCPGYVIDHVVALACGGADAPYNMQWQSIVEGKAKDGWERKGQGRICPMRPVSPLACTIRLTNGLIFQTVYS